MASTCLTKVGTGPRLPLCSIPPSINNREQLSDLWEKIVVPLLSDRILASHQSRMFFGYFNFHNAPNDSSWLKVCRQAIPALWLFYCEDMLL